MLGMRVSKTAPNEFGHPDVEILPNYFFLNKARLGVWMEVRIVISLQVRQPI